MAWIPFMARRLPSAPSCSRPALRCWRKSLPAASTTEAKPRPVAGAVPVMISSSCRPSVQNPRDGSRAGYTGYCCSLGLTMGFSLPPLRTMPVPPETCNRCRVWQAIAPSPSIASIVASSLIPLRATHLMPGSPDRAGDSQISAAKMNASTLPMPDPWPFGWAPATRVDRRGVRRTTGLRARTVFAPPTELTQGHQRAFGLLAGVAANVYSAVTETADTRGWTLLPPAFYVTRARVARGKLP